MADIVTNVNLFMHPGLILILAGIIAAVMPQKATGKIPVAGAGIALAAMLMLRDGDRFVLPFINDTELLVINVDRLSFVFGMVFCMMALFAAIYAMHNKSRLEAAASMIYAGSSLGATLAGDYMTLVFFWEIMAVSSLFLVLANRTDSSRKAAVRYLLVHMFGGNMLLFGAVLKVSSGDMLIGSISGVRDAAFWLILLGVSINAAIPPLHAWIVDAYPQSTVTGGIFMSSFTTKVAVYSIIRMFPGTDFLVWVGIIMALYGALYALIENDMRKLLSYHIISQIGFMVAGVGIGTEFAINGATVHAFSQVLQKPLLFMCAGAIMYATGIKNINQLGGLAKKMPVVFTCFTVAAFSIAGVPFFSGFTSKSVTISAAAAAGYPLTELFLQVASVGTFLSIVMKMGYFIFFGGERTLADGTRAGDITVKRKLPANMNVAMIITATVCVIYGVYPDAVYNFLPYAMDYHPFTVDHFMQYVQLLSVSIIPFVIYIDKMEPHSKLSLDTDWLYRVPFAKAVKAVSSLCVTTQVGLGLFFRTLYNDIRMYLRSPFGNGIYNSDKVREPAGNIMLTALFVLVGAVIYIVLLPSQIV